MRTDAEIRSALLQRLKTDDPTAAIFQELPIGRGVGRADVAAINGKMIGYEIKSERDTLRRIVAQRNHYDSLFDHVVIVVARPHLRKVREAVPKQWGIMVADDRDGITALNHVRKARKNPAPDARTRAMILWKRECVVALANNGIRVDPTAPILRMWERVAALPMSRLADEVRDALKRRQSVEPRAQCGDSHTTEATE